MMMIYSLINVPYASLLGVMSSDPQVRTELSSYRMSFAFGGSILVLALVEPLTNIFSQMKLVNGGPSMLFGWQMSAGVSSSAISLSPDNLSRKQYTSFKYF